MSGKFRGLRVVMMSHKAVTLELKRATYEP